MIVLDLSNGVWGIMDPEPDRSDSDMHLVPCNDMFTHKVSPDCWCHPTKERNEDNNTTLYVHSSADGREYYEPGQRRLH